MKDGLAIPDIYPRAVNSDAIKFLFYATFSPVPIISFHLRVIGHCREHAHLNTQILQPQGKFMKAVLGSTGFRRIILCKD